jgi:3-deoxy-D-manno-octulosonic acid kinase
MPSNSSSFVLDHADWPFAARAPLALSSSAQREISGLPGVWNTRIVEGYELTGEPTGLTGAFGRGGVFRLGDVVVRPYRRGGLLGRVVRRHYLSSGRFEAEWAVHRELWEAGFPTVKPLGYAWRRSHCGVQGAYFTAYQEGSVPWPNAWDRSSEVLPRLGDLLECLCEHGYWAPDLNATNVLLVPGGGILLLDWDRTRRRWNQKTDPEQDCRYALFNLYIERLSRSLKKRNAPESVVQAFQAL